MVAETLSLHADGESRDSNTRETKCGQRKAKSERTYAAGRLRSEMLPQPLLLKKSRC